MTVQELIIILSGIEDKTKNILVSKEEWHTEWYDSWGEEEIYYPNRVIKEDSKGVYISVKSKPLGRGKEECTERK